MAVRIVGASSWADAIRVKPGGKSWQWSYYWSGGDSSAVWVVGA